MIPQPLQPEPIGGRARSSRARGGSPMPPRPLGECRDEGAFPRPGFTLVELLIVVSIILVLMSMLAAGMVAARGSQRKQATQSLIARIDRVIQQQYASYASRAVSGTNRDVQLRQLVSAEMPENWNDVPSVATSSATAPQRAYVGYRSQVNPTPAFADAECLFMIVMVGGIADCLDCGDLANAQIGDADGDGAAEFRDAWGQPIRYVLWPAGFELPPGSKFFSTTAPFSAGAPAAARGGTMRPLIYSTGGSSGTPPQNVARDGSDLPSRAITNFDAEIGK